jgi:serine protease inhibitor
MRFDRTMSPAARPPHRGPDRTRSAARAGAACRAGAAARASAPGPLPVGRRSLLAAPPALLGAGALLAGCGDDARAEDLRSEVEPATPPGPDTAHGRLAPFTARMLEALGGEGTDAPTSTVCSPASALIALAMLAQGAKGETLSQMEDVLGGTAEELADLAGTLRVTLAGVGAEQREDQGKEDPDPAVAQLVDAAWIQEDLEVEDDFLDDLARGFDAGLHTADFTADRAREKARDAMNDLVEEATDGLIEELVPRSALGPDSRLVLLNALHLKGAWPEPLNSAGSRAFTGADGSTSEVEMMTAGADGWFEDDQVQAVCVSTYGGELALVLARPVDDVPSVLAHWEEDDGAALADLLDGVTGEADGPTAIFPPLDLSAQASLDEALEGLGMSDVLDPQRADLTGISPQADLCLSSVLQKSVITVDEQGMEAASATAAIAGVTSAPAGPPKELVLDVPFLFLAIERSTRAPLVVGWCGEGSGSGS